MRVVCQMLVHTSRALPVCALLALFQFLFSAPSCLACACRRGRQTVSSCPLPSKATAGLTRCCGGLYLGCSKTPCPSTCLQNPSLYQAVSTFTCCLARSHVRAQVFGFSHQYRTLSKPPVSERARSYRGALFTASGPAYSWRAQPMLTSPVDGAYESRAGYGRNEARAGAAKSWS